jgi:hypothetical protein
MQQINESDYKDFHILQVPNENEPLQITYENIYLWESSKPHHKNNK